MHTARAFRPFKSLALLLASLFALGLSAPGWASQTRIVSIPSAAMNRAFGATVVLEFVGPEDEMTLRLLRNKRIAHSDYTFARFEAESLKLFEIADQAPLKQGKRRIYLLRPKPNATGPQAAA